ncbi:MAG: hypothetical protein WC415_00725, partial [Patescibacteria group bacterium]
MSKNFEQRKRKIFLLALFFVAFLTFCPLHPAKAQTTDFTHVAMQVGKFIYEKFQDLKQLLNGKVASSLYRSILSNALNTMAFDTATWLGSGGRGQKPLFVTDAALYARNIGDAAAGQFIETLGKNIFGVSICEPSLNAKLKIGLGLVQQERPATPNCTLSKMYSNWSEAKLDPNFLKDFYESIDPTGTDLGAALYIQNKEREVAKEATDNISKKLEKFQNFLTPTNAGGQDLWAPKTIEKTEDLTWGIIGQNMLTSSGNALVDAAKVFTNQLALTAFQNGLKKLAGTVGTGYAGDYGRLLSAEANPFSVGTAEVKNSARKLIEPSFATRGDYEILSSLSICNRNGNLPVGLTDCVIDERFRQAVEQKKTVGEAIKSGLLNGSVIFGFKISAAGDPVEPDYTDGLSYRSMMILRKYRIIPVGWELAAEYIKNHPEDSEVTNNATLGKLVDCYSDKDEYGDFSKSWCIGLVDPNWVLKAPQNYCAKEGYGSQIIYKQAVEQGQESIQAENDVNKDGEINSSDQKQIELPPKLMVSRLDNYCADEQSCIKENDDGSCQYYGYCEEEKREWRFDGESCEANFNTCETFRNSKGQTASFLQNTLSFCSSDDFGCKNYAIPAAEAYNFVAGDIDWTKISGNIYFNKNAETCSAEDNSCRALIRMKSGAGANLLADGNFEDNNIGDNSSSDGLINYFWPISGYAEITDIVVGEFSDSGKVLLIDQNSSPAGVYSFDHSAMGRPSVLPAGFVFEPETSYTLSVDVYIEVADRVVLAIGRDGGYQEEVEITGTGWQRPSVTIYNNEQIAADQFTINGYAVAGQVRFYIDNIKLEVGDSPTTHSLYGQKGLVYEKLLPVYLEEVCYLNPKIEDYRIKPTAPSICKNYARKCSREEVGCQGFTPVLGGAEIPASITDKDYCLEECDGYSSLVQKENNFNTIHSKYFIPLTARSCSAAEVGCEEFTNLDKSTAGGEAREYYSYLRQCVKPDAPAANCADFYVWSGTNESGQQLSKISLQADAVLPPNDPGVCDETIFNLPPGDPHYNLDCRQFYSQTGEITYHLYSRTISCTADCHPYRLSEKNYLEGVTTQAACAASGYEANSLYWDAGTQACLYCAGGGAWNDDHTACVYNAYPAESNSCSAAVAGCGEYNGNQGNNIKSLVMSTFENGADGWNHFNSTQEAISGKYSCVLAVGGGQGGGTNDINYKIGTAVKKGQPYVISFVAKASGQGASVGVSLKNSVASQQFSAGAGLDFVTVKPDIWGVYTLNLPSLDHFSAIDEVLLIKSSATILIDNINFSAINSRYFLTRDSWNTPTSCDSDSAGRPYPLYMLGCSAYTDRLGGTHYLHSFDRLCQDSAIGCEALIDTKNSSLAGAKDHSNGLMTFAVPADEMIYAVYDTNKICSAADKGCELLGEVSGYEGENAFTPTYLKNDPDKYDKIFCSPTSVGCDKWTSDSGEVYFKDPGNIVCEWRQAVGAGQASGWGWYKKKVKRCGGTGAICTAASQCLSGQDCSLENIDNPCPTNQFKTFGQGGLGNEIYQPTVNGD